MNLRICNLETARNKFCTKKYLCRDLFLEMFPRGSILVGDH